MPAERKTKMNNSEKTTMQYSVFTAKNPKTGEAILRPAITKRNKMNMKQLVAYAKNAAYVTGQTKNLEGQLGGFIQAMQDRALAGYSINVNDWFIISGRLKGTVDETRQLTSDNKYHVTITATKDLKASIKNFNWQRVDEGVIIKVESITSPGGKKGEITKTKAIVVNGKNLAFDAAWGDNVTVAWLDGETENTLDLTPSEQSETYLLFDWPTELADVAAGTELVFSFRLHGAEGEAEQMGRLTATLVAA